MKTFLEWVKEEGLGHIIDPESQGYRVGESAWSRAQIEQLEAMRCETCSEESECLILKAVKDKDGLYVKDFGCIHHEPKGKSA